MKYIFPSPPARAISFSLVRITTLGQSVYPDIALHISDYYINIALYIIFDRQRYVKLMYYEAQETIITVRFGVMVLNATFNNMSAMSWRYVY
jgi:formylmethanofuran dehydrogenase subunit D